MIPFEIRSRIAPTPSGFLHIGNLYSFVLTWLVTKSMGGTLLLRIDDLDAPRIRREYLEDLFEILDFAGIEPDEGPSGVNDFLSQYSQQSRIPVYLDLINNLKANGCLYACTCSRKNILAQNGSGLYPGNCRKAGLDFGLKGAAWRLKLEDYLIIQLTDEYAKTNYHIPLTERMGDFVVLKKDGIPSYQVASLADDIQNGINLIVRGEDLLASSASQIYLARLTGIQSFEKILWYHHPLLKNENHQKLSKSAGDTSIRQMIKNGMDRKQFLLKMAGLLKLPLGKYESLNDLLETWKDRSFGDKK